MSDIGIGSIGDATTVAPVTSAGNQGLDKDTFLSLLVAQVKYQNPLEPTDSSQMLSQASQYAMVEQLENMSQAQAEIRSIQMISVATGLVGEDVVAFEQLTGTTVSGVVEGVRFGTEPILIVDGFEVPLSSVISVGENVDLNAPPTSPTPPTDPQAGPSTPTDGGPVVPIEAADEAVAVEADPPINSTIELSESDGEPLTIAQSNATTDAQSGSSSGEHLPIEAVRDEVKL